MTKRTSMNLDMELVKQARAVLGTGNATDTVHEALRQAVRRHQLERAAEVLLNMGPEQADAIEAARREERAWDDVFPSRGEPGYEEAMREHEAWVEQGRKP